ncbi:MAG TPA: OmpA family protein [Polyangiaceae bacterium]|nr:OmpA family protein [Polyangiaceae bacterium]
MKYRGKLNVCAGLLVASMCAGSVARAQGDEAPPAAASERSKLEIVIDKSKVDLKEHRLEVKMNRVATRVTIKVFDEAGAVLADQEHDFSRSAAGTALIVAWSPSSDAAVGRIEVFGYDEDGAYKGIAITPWSVAIPHEEVNFRRDSADIDDAEKPKLDASFTKVTEAILTHGDLGKISLFIAGHTDSVGTSAYNLQLSRARAQAIAGWFRKRGLKIPIAFEGFGESALLVKTPDETDEPRNRRVDYILSIDEPSFKTSGFRPAWKRAN